MEINEDSEVVVTPAIKVSEVFYSIQGEGIARGTPAVFLRFPHCNLSCKGEDWQCDSFAMRNVYDEYTPTSLWKKIISLNPNMLEYILDQRVHLIYTGGEPGMEANSLAINQFRSHIFNAFSPGIVDEMETNGSVELSESYKMLLLTMSIVNCSPKLKSSGNSFEKRYNKETLKFINELPQSYFKFVVSNHGDLKEILDTYEFLNTRKIILMPATNNLDGEMTTDLKWKQFVWDFASKRGWRYSGRDHIDVWGSKVGV